MTVTFDFSPTHDFFDHKGGLGETSWIFRGSKSSQYRLEPKVERQRGLPTKGLRSKNWDEFANDVRAIAGSAGDHTANGRTRRTATPAPFAPGLKESKEMEVGAALNRFDPPDELPEILTTISDSRQIRAGCDFPINRRRC